MNELLLDLGTEGMTLKSSKDKKVFTEKQIKKLLELLMELERLSRAIDRKGVKFSKYLSYRHQKTKKLPIFMVKVGGKDQFLFSDSELAKITQQEEKDPGKELEIAEFFEAAELEKILNEIEKMGIDVVAHYEVAQEEQPKTGKAAKAGKADPIYKVIYDSEERPIFCLKELLKFVTAVAKKGMSIQRYKGLGEMNPGQLWETTMDPARRTVLKVTLEDAVKADEMFTVLMGDAVEPRRQFIETHAREVRNLDI
ncbi:MAG: hypothetical protein JW714_00065 [Candidatus Omnitrophica bacterium]|nr:hypothetical protein [Candidatus Omnitrophota bacterium]